MDFSIKLPLIGKNSLILLAIGALFVLPAAQAGGIYKWVDEQGNVHYSQDPQGHSAEEMKLKIHRSSTEEGESAEKTAQDDSAAQGEKNQGKDEAQTKAEKEASAQDQKEAKAKNCQIAMKRLAAINSGGRLYEVNEKGERNYWDDNTRKAKLEEAQKNVDQWCGQE